MANGDNVENAALSLYQLLGAPLYALIEAESYAAEATANFIERVGFEGGQVSPDEANRDFGQLRTVSFKQERRDAAGEAASYKVEVPLLSILPIPAMQIREAELEFFVKIVDIIQQGRKTTGGQPSTTEPKEENNTDALQKISGARRIDFKTVMGRGPVNNDRAAKSAFDMQVHVKIKVEQADIPAGLSRLFNLMEQSITSTDITQTGPS